VKLSPAGEVLFSEVKRLLPQIELAGTKAKRAALGQYGLVRIAFSERLAAEHRGAVAAFAKTRLLLPDVEFRLATMNSDDQIAGLVAGDLDVGVLYRQPPFPSGLKYRSISTLTTKLLVNSKDPLAKKPHVKLADLKNYDMALVARSKAPITYGEILAACARGGLAPRIAFEVNTDAALVNLVAEGLAIGFVDSSLTRRQSTAGATVLSVEDFDYKVHLVVLWQADRETPAIVEFADQLIQHLDETEKSAKSRRRKSVKRTTQL
jgi:DNA-binding transcriptional LysR family regulator